MTRKPHGSPVRFVEGASPVSSYFAGVTQPFRWLEIGWKEAPSRRECFCVLGLFGDHVSRGDILGPSAEPMLVFLAPAQWGVCLSSASELLTTSCGPRRLHPGRILLCAPLPAVLYCGLSAQPLGTRSSLLDLHFTVMAPDVKFRGCTHTCFPSFTSRISVPPSRIFVLTTSSCCLPQTGSGSELGHNLSLSVHRRTTCTDIGVLSPSVCSQVCYDPAFSPQDLVCRIFFSVAPCVFGTPTMQGCSGGWPAPAPLDWISQSCCTSSARACYLPG